MEVTITLTETAKVFNDKGPKIVIDGGGKVTLSGGGKVRILYQNTCDQKQVWTTPQCQNQDHPQLTVQNLTFGDGNAKGETMEGGGGGAIFVRGGRFKLLNSRFFRNVCDDVGPDVGGAAVWVLSQHEGKPVHVVNSTFGGAAGLGNTCSNGGGLSSTGLSYTVLNSLFSHNKAIGNGANPAKPGTPGGGSGGAIYNILAAIRNGINVIQGNLEKGLDEFADQAFDHVVLSRTLQTVRHTEGIQREMLRVGREAVVSFPNFAYCRNLRSVLEGRMPVSKDLPYQWYDSPNVRFFTLLDFEDLCDRMGLVIRERHVLDEEGNLVENEVNFLGSLAVYRLTLSR